MHRLSHRRLGSLGAALGAVALWAGCGGSELTLPGDTGPADITKIGGDNQTGAAGTPLTTPLVVKVINKLGEPVPNQRVAFAPDGDPPGASVIPGEVSTDSEGLASAQWVLGAPSGTQAVIARVVGVDGLSVRFEAVVGSGSAAKIEAADGDNQSSAVGTAVANPLVVLVTDQFGNPVPAVSVEWDAQAGSVDPGSTTTGPDGRAETSWVLGTSTGSQTATASSSGLNGSPVTFTGTAIAGSADRLVPVSGNNQSAGPGQELDAPVVVRLVDRQGNGIPDRPVSWVIGAGGGSVASTTSITDERGEASARWTLGPAVGTNTLNAVVSGVQAGVVGFTATATSGGGGGGGGGGGSGPTRLEFRVQPSDVEEDRLITPPVEVVVLDQAGNRVTEGRHEIKLELTGDDGELKGDRSQRTESGVASFDDLKVDKDGDYRLRASADGLPSVDSDVFHVRKRD